jgi:hypothetical protein
LAATLLAPAIAVAPGQMGIEPVRTMRLATTTSVHPTAPGDRQGPGFREFPQQPGADAEGSAATISNPRLFVNRMLSSREARLAGPAVAGTAVENRNPTLTSSFNGLNIHDQRTANGGNQFNVEPPDQGLCAGNGFVMESVNDVLRIWNAAGTPLMGAEDLNSFYGYAPAINRQTGDSGPFVTDPSCYFDQDTGRWFHVVLTLDTDTSGNFLGPNHLDLAVSTGSTPTGTWNIYRLPVQDDGTQGTPNHHCSSGPMSLTGAAPPNPTACIGDFPHLGADRNGIYITTNEYSLFGPEFKGAQVYAFAKKTLASGAVNVPVVQFDTAGAVNGNPGFTLWPATTPGAQYATTAGGTEYFLSSMAAQEANNANGFDNRIGLWALSNTSSLGGALPSPVLHHVILYANDLYSMPPPSDQKPGAFPQGQCLNDPLCSIKLTRLAVAGVPLPIGLPDLAGPEVESTLDSSDTRMLTTVYADGMLWGALGTEVITNGQRKAGVAWFIIKPWATASSVSGSFVNQGHVALAGNNVIFPAIAVTPSGVGTMAFTIAGKDHYPSAGYARIDAAGVGAIHIAAEGLGAQDGFTGYKFWAATLNILPINPPRPRWGDYGAAVVDGSSIWIASEYIAHSCTLTEYEQSPNFPAPLYMCGGARTALANWSTRITQVRFP